MTRFEEISFLHWLKVENGYRDPKPLPNARYAAILPLAYTHAIIVGNIGDRTGYSDRWCYHNYRAAADALDAWDGTGEPEGWHRHPVSGRRRAEGDPLMEYVDP